MYRQNRTKIMEIWGFLPQKAPKISYLMSVLSVAMNEYIIIVVMV